MAVLMTTVADANSKPETLHNVRPIPEPGVEYRQTAGGPPPLFSYPRQPFEGLRLVGARVVHRLMPPTGDMGPAKVLRTIGGYRKGSAKAPQAQDRAAVRFDAVPGIEKPSWTEHLT